MRVLDVADVTAYLKDLIEGDPILSDVWIRGEVSGFTRSAAGHCYFSLANDGVQLSCVLFRGNQFGLIAMPRSGDAVLAHGRVTIYESRGQYQLIVDQVAPEGIGLAQLAFEETKRRLEADGLFNPERKRPLPILPAVVGVVTSAQGAVWHDIQTVIARRFPLVDLVLAPSAVQGAEAPGQLVAGLQALQELAICDVIIIGRGGGSPDDLAAFNDEVLARAIYAARVPVVSAVGHETDTCIADLVADVRAATPSAAAELCVPSGRELLASASQMAMRARGCAVQAIDERRGELQHSEAHLRRLHPRVAIEHGMLDLDALASRSSGALRRMFDEARRDIAISADRARLLDPSEVLKRGYALITACDDHPERRVTTAAAAASCGTLRIAFADGSVRASVTGREN